MARPQSSPPKARPPIAAFATLAFAAATLFAAPAYVRAAQTLQALQSGDQSALAERVDFPALRADLKADITGALDAHYAAAGAGETVKSLAGMIVAPLVDAIIDRAASPDGLAEIARLSRDPDAPPQTFPQLLGAAISHGGFDGPATFALSYADARARGPSRLVFARRNLVDWRLAGVDLPPEALQPH